ncbi:glycosyltransferase family 32 protein [Elizabethkingia miricola]|uniref:glycosyltransferase family 32 protein n=1 Tax=Elizabethkingia miricola TaxID=172045 RepID=UPI00099963DB|nr:glycosyltransferase [Elizabethkingia miricola]OPC34855.1 glycosyl transferase [Elizabethkingia miricola]
MIPKIIHYCWFGRGKMPELALKCINSWNEYMSDYEIMLWNEDNFDLNRYPYALEAYNEKKFAFVTDVCRLYALKKYGGIYMDTDVEILKPLDNNLLINISFSGFEDNDHVPTGIMGSIRGGQWVSDLLEYYENRSFFLADGGQDVTTNTHIITEFMKQEKGLIMNNTFQKIENYCTIYPSDYFCPKSWKTMDINITSNTYCIHHFAASWWAKPRYSLKYRIINFFLGKKNTTRLFNYYQNLK